MPSTATLSKAGVDRDRQHDVGGDEDLQPQNLGLAEVAPDSDEETRGVAEVLQAGYERDDPADHDDCDAHGFEAASDHLHDLFESHRRILVLELLEAAPHAPPTSPAATSTDAGHRHRRQRSADHVDEQADGPG